MKNSFWQKEGVRSVLASLLSIVIGLLAGSVIIVIVGCATPSLGFKSAWEGVRLVMLGLFSKGRDAVGNLVFGFNPSSVGNMLFRATPLIMTGLSVAVAFKTGLFNIGAPGQYLAGTAATLFIALSIPVSALPGWLIWMLAFAGGMLAGALWGAIPGLLKALLNINEVLACIMTNWIAANIVTWLFDLSNLKNIVENTKSGYVYSTAYGLEKVDGVWTYVAGAGVRTPKMGLDKLFPGSQVNGGIIIAIVLAIVVYIILTRTTFGYELKACGSNRFAARYAGIADKRSIVVSMAIAGALAGAAGSLYYLSGNTEFYWTTYQSLPAVGFNGIPVALLAINNPVGVIFAGIFMAMLDIVGMQLTNLTAYNEYITDVIISVIVYLSAFSLVIRMMLVNVRKRREMKKATVTTAPVPPEAQAQPLDAPEETPPDTDGEQEKGGEDA